MLAPAQTAGAADGDKVTFTVGLKNEVDSFNPFLGIEAPSYEMWALTYDYMVGYSMEDMSPVPALAKYWETSEDGLPGPSTCATASPGPTASRSPPRTSPTPTTGSSTARSGGDHVGAPTSPRSRRSPRPDDTTVVLKLSKPNAVLPLLPIPIIPEHIWKNVSEEEVKTYRQRADGRPAGGRAPVPSGSWRARRGARPYRFEANPDYWGGAPHVDEVVFRVFKAEDPMVQALIKGEVDFIHDISPVQVDGAQGTGRDHRAQRGLAVLRRDRVQHRRGRHRDRTSRSVTATRR